MANEINNFQEIISHCKEYGYIFQSSELYDGLSAVYDYGQMGAQLKKNLRDEWWKSMTQMHENIVGIDAAIFMHPTVWKASGHVDNFSDPMIDNKDSNKRYRVDHLIEAHVETLEKEAGEAMIAEMDRLLAADDLAGLKTLIESNKIKCGISKTCNWTDVRQFNLMFSTQIGSVAEEADTIYLRPETAQGIFVNFLNVQKSTRQKIPFGIAQIGKAFRNEIVARQFIFRMREFEQMEMQFFVKPGEEMQWYDYWKQTRMNWHLKIGTPQSKLRFKDHDNLAHYANAAVDIQFDFPFGFKELEGIHSRTNFDLSSHQELSGKKLQYFDPELNENYVPYVVETSVGADRMFLSLMSDALIEETVPDADGKDSTRVVLKLHPALAPIKVAVLPLLKNKEELTNAARDIFNRLKMHFMCQYDEKDAIGRRYRRQDAIGTPFCVTVDFDTLEDNTVTIRDRDTLIQERVHIDQIEQIVRQRVGVQNLLV